MEMVKFLKFVKKQLGKTAMDNLIKDGISLSFEELFKFWKDLQPRKNVVAQEFKPTIWTAVMDKHESSIILNKPTIKKRKGHRVCEDCGESFKQTSYGPHRRWCGKKNKVV